MSMVLPSNEPYLSALDMYSIGIGPSSSHTVGPMRAAAEFAHGLGQQPVARVACTLYGSLADTGKGHGTDRAVLLGLMGEDPKTVDIDAIEAQLTAVADRNELTLPGGRTIAFSLKEDLVFARGQVLSRHPNGMQFSAVDADANVLAEAIVYSVGGGFIRNESEWDNGLPASVVAVPYPFTTGAELLAHCLEREMSMAEVVWANETALRSEVEVRRTLDEIWGAMQACIERGLGATGTLPGGLKVARRAKTCHEALCARQNSGGLDPLAILDWVDLYALAVNEENAAGGRVVTAPTNGAAGVLPAVLKYATRFTASPHSSGVHRFLLTAGAIATLYKRNASLSGADVGCQGEVGVACSMAAGALTEFLGGTPAQVEFAAEIGMEHNLGLTCDPIGGLVQIPCIERNAMGAVKAINASRLALAGDSSHFVSLDKVIATMLATGRDMQAKYKETARGGLAVNVVEC